MALVSVIGAYIGILVALIVGVAQIRVQLRQQADVENTEEGHELLPNLTSLESLEHVDLESGPDSDEEEEEEHDLDPSETSTTNLNPAEPLEQHRSSFTSTNTLPGHTGHHRRSSIELFCFHPSTLDDPDALSLALDPSNSRPTLARGISAPLFLH
ncbi:hypothetical protein HDK90DRAFT_510155 [Phyllosticta capitalensis]|uniref:Uncharacterized protein n=1 Tax=Phyllosticta capitalensis TaxID=121624 RepID=A0ABR1YU59_9PEZI